VPRSPPQRVSHAASRSSRLRNECPCPCVRVADGLHAESTAVYDACVMPVLVASTVLTVHLARLPGWGAVVLTVAFWLLPHGDFGQREHLMVASMCPYAGLLVRRIHEEDAPTAEAAAAGALASLGICFKPHFALVWAGWRWRCGRATFTGCGGRKSSRS
jgi:hypothetical protein